LSVSVAGVALSFGTILFVASVMDDFRQEIVVKIGDSHPDMLAVIAADERLLLIGLTVLAAVFSTMAGAVLLKRGTGRV
jgi:hypothetical protein